MNQSSPLPKIEWTDHTFNPWIGCTKVSPGCAHCYAETRDKRHLIEKVDHWGKGAPRYRTSESGWKQVLKWNREAPYPIADRIQAACPVEIPGPRPRVFPSQCDWLDDEVPIEWLADFLDLIRRTPNLDWLLLTKRPENFSARINLVRVKAGDPFTRTMATLWQNDIYPPNVWLGVSVEDQTRADERIPKLLETPAAVRFLSCEPLLGPLNLQSAIGNRQWPDWCIVGGESGPKARPCDIQWIHDIVEQCKTAGVPVFVKQMGSRSGIADPETLGGFWYDAEIKDPKGGDPREWAADLRVREFPSVAAVPLAP